MAEPEAPSTRGRSNLASRVVVTWAELTVLGIAGGVLGTSVGGPPALVVYFATTLVSVGILLYNVNVLVQRSIDARVADGAGE